MFLNKNNELYKHCMNRHFDTTGKRLILLGDIVTIPDRELYFHGDQGLVVHTDNKDEEGHFISVFFDVEVSEGQFHDWPEASSWAKEHWFEPRWPMIGNIELANSCPRVTRFKPEELQVVDEWDISKIAVRGAGPGGACWTHSTIPGKPFISGAYLCFLPGCENVATEIAFPNCWGTMGIVYTCRDCFSQVHGMRGDSYPEMKNPLPERFPYSSFPRVE